MKFEKHVPNSPGLPSLIHDDEISKKRVEDILHRAENRRRKADPTLASIGSCVDGSRAYYNLVPANVGDPMSMTCPSCGGRYKKCKLCKGSRS
jgi:hypothetical protein